MEKWKMASVLSISRNKLKCICNANLISTLRTSLFFCWYFRCFSFHFYNYSHIPIWCGIIWWAFWINERTHKIDMMRDCWRGGARGRDEKALEWFWRNFIVAANIWFLICVKAHNFERIIFPRWDYYIRLGCWLKKRNGNTSQMQNIHFGVLERPIGISGRSNHLTCYL